METPFLKLAEICNALEKTTKINEKIDLITNFLSKLDEFEIEPAVFFIIGTIFAETDPHTLDIKWKTLIETKSTPKQMTLLNKPLTIREVQSYFMKLAQISGAGARKKRLRLIEALFRQATSIEKKFLIRNILGEMRHGVAEGVMVKAIAKAKNIDIGLVKQKSALHGNLGEIARIVLIEGLEGLKKVELKPFKPIKPMLAASIDSIDELFKNSPGQIALEYKYDGIRAQIHKAEGTVRIYSRQLKEITSSFPEIVEDIMKFLPDHSIILDGEIIAIGDNNRPLAFQELMRRLRRVHQVQRVKQIIAVKLYIFDILYLNNEVFLEIPYEKRWNILMDTCRELNFVSRTTTTNKNEIKTFFKDALQAGHEGIIIKDPKSSYFPNERKKVWLKLKEATELDLIIVAADWGSGRRSGWLSNYHLAARDPEKGTFHVIGKTFKGLTDDEFKKMTIDLQDIKTNESNYTVYVKPQIVVEVAFNEIQKSPTYSSGYALRFARIKRIRSDKNQTEVTTLDEIADLYERQFHKKAKL